MSDSRPASQPHTSVSEQRVVDDALAGNAPSHRQTAYTLDTAGWDGFAQILPVYLEHVIVPTLTDAGCYTEVHHINGTGHDAGVVYSEMQGVQNDQEELMDLSARRLMYPEGNGPNGGPTESYRSDASYKRAIAVDQPKAAMWLTGVA